MNEIFGAFGIDMLTGMKTDVITVFIAALTIFIILKGVWVLQDAMESAEVKGWREKRRSKKLENADAEGSGERKNWKLVRDYDSLHDDDD